MLYEQAIAERFRHDQDCLTRVPERSTKYGKERTVPATPKMYQMVKTIDNNEETVSTNGQNTQLASKWQDQFHT